jgi:hypothetical protein
MMVTTAGLTRAAAETTLPFAGAAAVVDEPPVPPAGALLDGTKFATVAGVSVATTGVTGRSRAPDAMNARVVPPDASAAAAIASAAIPATARFRVVRAAGGVGLRGEGGSGSANVVPRSAVDADNDPDGTGIQGGTAPGTEESKRSVSMMCVVSSRQG